MRIKSWKPLYRRALAKQTYRPEPKEDFHHFHPNTATFFEILTSFDYFPSHVVDIGAHKGDWSISASKVWPSAMFTLFEPQHDLLDGRQELKGSQFRIEFLGVGLREGTGRLTQHHRRDSYSFAWDSDDAELSSYPQIPWRVTSLDSYFLGNPTLPLPNVVKIDAEGWDLEVIQGSPRVLPGCDIVFVEATVLSPRYKNSALAVINQMSMAGFGLADITDLNRTPRSKRLWMVELAFVRKSHPIFKQMSVFD